MIASGDWHKPLFHSYYTSAPLKTSANTAACVARPQGSVHYFSFGLLLWIRDIKLRYLVHQFRKPQQCSALFRIDCTRCVFRDCVSFFFLQTLWFFFLFMVRIAITAQTNTLQKNLKNRRVQTYQSVYAQVRLIEIWLYILFFSRCRGIRYMDLPLLVFFPWHMAFLLFFTVCI